MIDVTLRVLRARLADSVAAYLGPAANLLAAKFMTAARNSADALLVGFALLTLAALLTLMVL